VSRNRMPHEGSPYTEFFEDRGKVAEGTARGLSLDERSEVGNS